MPSRDKDSKSAEDRRITRMHQMEMMEAAARGTAPSMQLDTSHVPPTQGLRSRNTSSSSSNEARRFLTEDEVDSSGGSGRDGTSVPSGIRGTSTASLGVGTGASGTLFNQRDAYGVDQTINLMDPEAETYTPAPPKSRTSFVDIFLGGHGKTSGTGNTNQRGSVHTTWDQSYGGRFLVLLFFVGFGVLLAMSVSFLVQDTDEDVSNGNFVKTGNRYEDVKGFLLLNSASHVEYLTDKQTSAYHALRWLTDTDTAKLEADDSEILARFALASFYYATHPDAAADHSSGKVTKIDSGWKKDTNWMSKSSVCDWYGVDCENVGGDSNKDVVHFNLTANDVKGTIPMELKSLSNLVLLDLSDNQLKGTIPAPLCRMFQITYFLLQNNQLTGILPNNIGLMEGASEIYLTNNNIRGTIPSSITKLSNLKALFMGQNDLTGSIPDVSGLTGLNHLNLQDNKLSGAIPFSVAKLTNLHDLRLNKNQLKGTLHTELATNKKLRLLYLGNNLLSGTLPNMFDDLHALTDMELHNNKFTGKLPDSFQYMTSIRRLTVDYNKFSGTLPPQWGKMTDLEALGMHHNEVKGGIPTEFGGMTSMAHLILNHNFLQYTLPTELASLTKLKDLFLEHNAFKGEIPTEFGKLTKLEKFRIFTTHVEGAMPKEICDLKEKNLRELEAECDEVSCDCCKCH